MLCSIGHSREGGSTLQAFLPDPFTQSACPVLVTFPAAVTAPHLPPPVSPSPSSPLSPHFPLLPPFPSSISLHSMSSSPMSFLISPLSHIPPLLSLFTSQNRPHQGPKEQTYPPESGSGNAQLGTHLGLGQGSWVGPTWSWAWGSLRDWGNPSCLCLQPDEAGGRCTGQPHVWDLPHASWLNTLSSPSPQLGISLPPVPHPSSLAPSPQPFSLPPSLPPSIWFPMLSFWQFNFFF